MVSCSPLERPSRCHVCFKSKHILRALVGPHGSALQEVRVFLVLLSGAVATVFACFGVCPAEACRIRMVADPELNAQGLLKVVQARC